MKKQLKHQWLSDDKDASNKLHVSQMHKTTGTTEDTDLPPAPKNKKVIYTGIALVSLAVGGVVLVSLFGKRSKANYSFPTTANKSVNLPTPAPTYTPTNNSYTAPAQTSKYGYADTIAMQKFLYEYYPQTIASIGDIGTNGKPDGIWGNNTQKVVNSVVEEYSWKSEAELVEWAKQGKVPSFLYREQVQGLGGIIYGY